MSGSREQGRFSAKVCKFLEQPSKYQIFKKDPVAWS
jgi:hypothetical protein